MGTLLICILLGTCAIILTSFLIFKHDSIYKDQAVCIAIIIFVLTISSLYFGKIYYQKIVDEAIHCYIFGDFESYIGTDDQEHFKLIKPEYD